MFFDTVIKDSRTEMQEGGPLLPMMDPQGNLPPEEVAADVVNGAPMGMVDVPNGGGPVDDGVPTELPEGTFVLNAAAIQYHGTETIDKLINDAVRDLLKEGVQISAEDPNPDDDVPVAISNGEYVIPPEVAEKIGYKKLEDMNERGLEYRKKQEESQKKQAEAQPPAQPSQPPQEAFMGLQMPPEQAGPPQAPVQSEPQAMAMMGMANGGTMQRTPLKDGTPENNDGLGTAISAVTRFVNSFFGKPYTGAGQEVGFDYPEDIGPTRGEYYDLQSPPIENQNDGSTRGEFYDDPANAATNPAQEGMLQQGGFVENYTYAQPQQPTMGTPFSNAASTNSQQYNSFVQPNKQRVNAADGVEVPALQYGASVGALAPMQNYVNSLLVGLPDDDPQVPLLNGALEQIQKGIVPRGFGFTEKYKNDIFPITPDEEPFSIEPAPEKAPAITVPPPLNDRAAADGGFIKLQDGDQVKKKILVV